MSRVCHFSGKRTTVGRIVRYRGRAKYLGGIGKKVTSCEKRTFKPNLQMVTAMIDGSPRRIKVSTWAIKNGLVTKPVRRKYAYTRKRTPAQ
jgi:large subunit ribosomal protein L28